MKIGVATKDGVSVNLHFGHADTFWIYDVTRKSFALYEKREVDKYCHDHTDSQTIMNKILECIKGCHAVFSAKIGDVPAEKLEQNGIKSVQDYAYESIGESLLDYAQHRVS